MIRHDHICQSNTTHNQETLNVAAEEQTLLTYPYLDDQNDDESCLQLMKETEGDTRPYDSEPVQTVFAVLWSCIKKES